MASSATEITWTRSAPCRTPLSRHHLMVATRARRYTERVILCGCGGRRPTASRRSAASVDRSRRGSGSVWLWGQRGRFLSVFLELCRHRVTQAPRLPGQPLELQRSSHGPAILTTDVADGFEVGEQFVEEGEQLSQHG